MSISLNWIWPFNWRLRIKQLEAELELERHVARQAMQAHTEALIRHSIELQGIVSAANAAINSCVALRGELRRS